MQDDQWGIVSCDNSREPCRSCSEGKFVSQVGVINVRLAAQQRFLHELALCSEFIASGMIPPEGSHVNRQPIAMQHVLALEIWVENDERDTMSMLDQGADLRKHHGVAKPNRNFGGGVEKVI